MSCFGFFLLYFWLTPPSGCLELENPERKALSLVFTGHKARPSGGLTFVLVIFPKPPPIASGAVFF